MPDNVHTKYLLSEDEMPQAWYNIMPDLPKPPEPVLHPGTKQPVTPDDLAPLFPMSLIMQEVSTEPYIEIPEPVRQVYRRRNPEFKDFDTEETVFAKYRDVGGGVMWPMSMKRERNGEKLFEIYSESVQINKNLTDDLFTLPEKTKILPKAK